MEKFTRTARKRLFIVLPCMVTLMVMSLSGFSQHVAINTTLNPANTSAGLDIDFANSGFLITRLALTSLTSFAPLPVHIAGMMVYNTATVGNVSPGLYFDDGTKWVSYLPPAGTAAGDLQYWNGTGWVVLPAGTTGQILQFGVGGIPVWGNGAFASLVTTAVTAITSTTATSGGAVITDGGTLVTARGVCWNTATGPTIANSKTIDGAGLGGFVSNLTGLTTATIYYVRAYATNSAGTSYGNELSFTTP